MTARIRNESALAMIYGRSRDNYRGEFLHAVAAVREPVRVVSVRRSNNVVLIAIAASNHVDYWRVTNPDDPRLQLLGCDDRGQAHCLLISINREVGDA